MNLMGASKRLMEDMIFSRTTDRSSWTTSAKFANVAFSDGSLLHGFLQRLEKRQPLAVPRDTRRYFMSHQEAGELCLLATTLMPDRHIAIPKLDPEFELHTLESIAVRFLEHFGFTPRVYEDEVAAKRDLDALAAGQRWPILLTPLNTTGEKSHEEFVGDGEIAMDCGLKAVMALRHLSSNASMIGLLERLEHLVNDPAAPIDKRELIEAICGAVPSFQHVETQHSLDQRF